MVFVWRDYCFASEDLTGMQMFIYYMYSVPVLTLIVNFKCLDSCSYNYYVYELPDYLIQHVIRIYPDK